MRQKSEIDPIRNYSNENMLIHLIGAKTLVWMEIDWPGIPTQKGRISTVDLLVLIISDEFLFILKIPFLQNNLS
jgi:hypothetical protein